MEKTYHYWAIHKQIFRRFWNRADHKTRVLVSNKCDWLPEYKDFVARVNAEALRSYEDENYYYNERTSFVEQPGPLV